MMVLLRHLSLVAACNCFAFTASCTPGWDNSIPDALSRFDLQRFHHLVPHAAHMATPINNKEHLRSRGGQRCHHICACVRIPRACGSYRGVAYKRRSLAFCSMAAHHPGSSPPTPLPPSFHCFNNVMDACTSHCVEAHGWVARICQPWEQSSSRSWLPIVEAPGCLRHPTSILAMQLLMPSFNLSASCSV